MQQQDCKATNLKGVNVLEKEKAEGQVNPRRITSTTIIGNKVKNNQGKEVGEIEEIVFDLTCGAITYLVMSSGGLFGIGDKFFAVPMEAFTFDPEEKFFLLDVDKKGLKKHQGFDKNDWPMQPEWPPNGRRSQKNEPRRESLNRESFDHKSPSISRRDHFDLPGEFPPESDSAEPGSVPRREEKREQSEPRVSTESRAPIKARRR